MRDRLVLAVVPHMFVCTRPGFLLFTLLPLSSSENPYAILPEYALAHTVYILAHHPDFSRTNPQALDNFKE